MSTPFMGPDFLLHSETARFLYHQHAAKMPIIDYHCHLDPRMVATDHRFRSITELWLSGDHYKWRAMRANGVPERYITGDASDWEKFEQWAATMPYLLRNPLYHWTHLELRTAFGITDLLNPSTARRIYDVCNERLADPSFSACGLMRRYGVEVVCTTDDPIDSLEYHAAYLDDTLGFYSEPRMLPAWRPDKAMAIETGACWRDYIGRLAAVADTDIHSYASLLTALRRRHEFFHFAGCRLSDHGIDHFYATPYTDAVIERIFAKAMTDVDLTPEEVLQFKSAMLHDFAVMDAGRGWVQQFHYGPLRNNNSRQFSAIGPDTGYDSIGEFTTARTMAAFFNRLDSEHALARTIVYNLNPAANEMVAAMVGNFQEADGGPSKMQWGAAWWFSDQKEGIERQLNTLSLYGLLSRFVGMLTDSRSFLSYPRHEYFRRILCNLIGADVERGELPESEMERIAQMVEDICYNNAKNYFRF